MKMKLTDIRPASEFPNMYRQLEKQRTSTIPMVSGNWLHQRKDGSLMEVNILSMRLEVDNRVARLVIVEDVTEKRKTMNHLLMLESVITNINDAILITEAEPIRGDGPKIIYANKAFENMTGYTLEEIKDKTPRILQGPETDRSTLDRIHESLSKWEPAEAEIINYRKDGSPFWSHFSVVPVTDENGWYTYWISVQRNISGRKQAETEQRMLTQELLQQNRDLQQFSFIISHNFRAPIANMQGLLNLLDTNELSSESKLIIENLNTTVNQLDGTLNDLVKVVLLKSFTNLDSEWIQFDDVLFSTKLSLKHELDDKSIHIVSSFEQKPSVYSNRVALDNIFLHLISNSVKYRSPERDLVINISTQTDSEHTIIIIKDNGLGMNVDRYRDRIFGMHQRFHTHKEGRGMGLYMTNHQVMALGGHIEISGKENEGLEFRIFLKEKKGK
jgi:PAS domain S-box-containing protein